MKKKINRKRHRNGTDKRMSRKSSKTATIGTFHMFKKIDKSISALRKNVKNITMKKS